MSDEPIEAFCARVSPALVGSLTLQCGDRAVAEDLAQEALAITWERWDEVSAMANPGGWTYRVAFNLARSGHRRTLAEQRARGRLRHVEPIRHDEGDAVALRSALRTLTHRQRAAIVLRFYGQLSVTETAEAMDCAEGTVRALTSQGMERLRRLFPVDDEVEHDRG